MLDDRKILAIQHLAEGEKTKVEIAKICGVSRQAIYNWLEDEEFKAELDRRLHGRKVLVEKIIDSKLEDAVNSLISLTKTTKNDRVKAQSLQYIIDRGLGKTTSKVELKTNIANNANVDDDLLESALDDVIEYDDLEEQADNTDTD